MVVQDNLGATKKLCKEGKESLRILAIVVVGIWSDFFFSFLFFSQSLFQCSLRPTYKEHRVQ